MPVQAKTIKENFMIKKLLCIVSATFIALSLFGCTTGNRKDSGKLKIVTTLFPQYDFARNIAKDKADIELLLPAGVESHSFDPTANDIISINKSDVFIYTGKYMEVWAEKLITDLDKDAVKIVDVSKGINLVKEDEEEHEDDEHEDEHDHEYDPHIWTDPQNAKIMVDNITEALCEADKDNAEFYRKNAEEYKAQLDSLDNEFKSIVSESKHKELFFGGRFALYYFAKRYDINWTAAYDSCSTETEPSAKAVSEIIKQMKEKKIKVIYYEELVDPKVANTIAKETGAKALLLHSCHNVSKSDFDNGETYISLMKKNAENLWEGLN